MKRRKLSERSKKIALEAINDAFKRGEDMNKDMANADLFGVGCYLIADGKDRAGRKAIQTLLKAMGVNEKKRIQILRFVEQHPDEGMRVCNCHSEVMNLI